MPLALLQHQDMSGTGELLLAYGMKFGSEFSIFLNLH
jgi:hypothetical protein